MFTNLYRDAASLSVAASAFPWHQFAMASRSALMALMKIFAVIPFRPIEIFF